MAVLEAGQRVRVRGKSGFLLVQNANGTWTVDYDDNTEEDLAADEIEVEEAGDASPQKSAVGPGGETVESLAERHAALAARHAAALKSEDFKLAGELLTEMESVKDTTRRLERGDAKKAREREKTQHQEKLLELRRQFEREATAKFGEVRERVLALDAKPVPAG